MSRGVGVLGSENGTNTVNPLATTSNLKLLVELRRLSKVGVLVEVLHLENVCTTLGGGSNQTWGLKLDKVARLQKLGKKLPHSHADIRDSLLNRGSLVHDRVVQMSGQAGCRSTSRVGDRKILDDWDVGTRRVVEFDILERDFSDTLLRFKTGIRRGVDARHTINGLVELSGSTSGVGNGCITTSESARVNEI